MSTKSRLIKGKDFADIADFKAKEAGFDWSTDDKIYVAGQMYDFAPGDTTPESLPNVLSATGGVFKLINIGVAFGSVADPNATLPPGAKPIDGFRYYLTDTGAATGRPLSEWVYSQAANKWTLVGNGDNRWRNSLVWSKPSTTANGLKIKTWIPEKNYELITLKISGYIYGIGVPRNIDMLVSVLNHASFLSPIVTSNDNWHPPIVVAIENGVVVFFIGFQLNFPQVTVESFSMGALAFNEAHWVKWEGVDEPLSATATSITNIPYKYPLPVAATAGTTIVPAYFDTATGQLVTPTGTTLPTSVLDNTLTTPPTNAPDGATYIVPDAGATGLWAGKGNQKATWNEGLSTWSFYPPADNDKILVTTGPNVGNIYTYRSRSATGWGLTEQPTGTLIFPWIFSAAYDSGTIAIYNNQLFRANDAIPVATTFTIGDTGTTWTALGNPVKPITTDYTLLNDDAGFVITYSGATPINITCSGLADKSIVTVEQLGTGTITFVAGSLTPRHVVGLTKTAGQYSRVFGRVSGTEFILSGDLS